MEKYRTVFESWYSKFIPIISSAEFQELGAKVNNLRKLTKIYPAKQDVFRCFRETPLDKLSIIIWNDSPLLDERNDGLAFSTNTTSINETTRKFLDAIEQDIYEGLNLNFEPDLSYLANQGVLLFNNALTVPNVQDWDWFNNEMTDLINNLDWPIHVISIGEASQRYTKNLDCSVHNVESAQFTKWNHDACFRKANEFLFKHYGPLTTIKW